MVRREDNDASLMTLGPQETLQEIDAAAVQYAVGLVEQQESGLKEFPFSDRKTAFHPAGKGGNVFFRAVLQADLLKGALDLGERSILPVKRCEENEIFAHSEVFIEMVTGG